MRKPATSTARAGAASRGEERAALLLPILALSLLSVGCQQKMADQPSYKPLDPSSFFEDGQSARPTVSGTVARGHLRNDRALYTGKRTAQKHDWTRSAAIVAIAARSPLGAVLAAAVEPENDVKTFPFPISHAVLQHGRDRYMIYCIVCHDALGTGHGKIVERGYTAPPSYHIARLRSAPVGHFFNVITNGYGSMPSYADQVPPHDRWAITAYIRALQLSQHFPEKDLSDAMRQELRTQRAQSSQGGNR